MGSSKKCKTENISSFKKLLVQGIQIYERGKHSISLQKGEPFLLNSNTYIQCDNYKYVNDQRGNKTTTYYNCEENRFLLKKVGEIQEVLNLVRKLCV